MEGINKTGRGSASFGGGRQGSIGEAMQVDRYLINPTVALNKKKKKGCAQGVGLVKRRTGSFLSALTKKKKTSITELLDWTKLEVVINQETRPNRHPGGFRAVLGTIPRHSSP